MLSLRTKVAFGCGAAGEASINWLFNSLAFFYYNQILGLSGTLSALAVGIGIAFDAISDPLVGSISDRHQSRMGRRHPFMYLAPVPVALAILAMFHPPSTDHQTNLFLWFTLTTILMRAGSTLFTVPHLALGAELSDDYYERTRVMSFNSIFYLTGMISMHMLAWFYVFPRYDDGRMDQDAYLPIILFCMALVLVTMFSSALGTRSSAKPSLSIARSTGSRTAGLLETFSVLKNYNYRRLLVGLFLLSITIGTHETLNLYMGTFFWELTDAQMGWLILHTIMGYIIGFLSASKLHQMIEKRSTIVLSGAGLAISWSMAVSLRLLDLAPQNGTWELVAFLIFWNTIASACGSILNISVMSALADVADEHEVQTGRRQEGVFYSARTFFAKVSNGIGHVVAGIALDLIKFPQNATVDELSESQITALGILDGPFAMVWGLAAALVYGGYRIDKARLNEIQTRLRAKQENENNGGHLEHRDTRTDG